MKKFLKSKWVKWIIILIIILVVISAFKMKGNTPEQPRTATVTRGDIESFVDGSGAITASESRKVYTKTAGEVLSVLYEEGDFVEAGTVLARLDDSSLDATVDAQKIAIDQANLSISNIKQQMSDLTIVSNTSGFVSGLTISEGSYVTTSMQVCDVIEEGAFEIVLPFVYNEVNKIQVGNTATVQIIQNFAKLDGTVTKVSEMRKLGNSSSQVVDVTIKVPTTGYSLAGAVAKGEVFVNGTKQISTDTATFTSVKTNTIRAKSTGTVQKLNVYDGKYINVGDVIAVLSNDDLATSMKNANLSLQSLNTQYSSIKDQLDNYILKAPVSGTITYQGIEEGDMVAAGTPVITISNKEVLEFQIPVDELDIAKLNTDQEVRVTIDAIEETEDTPLQGKITKLPLEGVATGGVTEYYVTIQIQGNEKIRISMNASAKIITNSRKDVLMVPVDSVTKENGETYVTLFLEDGTTERRQVELGDRNVSYVEIKSGVNEGDRVVIPQLSDTYKLF